MFGILVYIYDNVTSIFVTFSISILQYSKKKKKVLVYYIHTLFDKCPSAYIHFYTLFSPINNIFWNDPAHILRLLYLNGLILIIIFIPIDFKTDNLKTT